MKTKLNINKKLSITNKNFKNTRAALECKREESNPLALLSLKLLHGVGIGRNILRATTCPI